MEAWHLLVARLLFAHWTQTQQARASVAQNMPGAETALARFNRWQIASATQ